MRDRIHRLLGVLAGVAIDEATALIISPGWLQMVVFSYVVACRKLCPAPPTHFNSLHGGDEGKLDGGVPIPGSAIPVDRAPTPSRPKNLPDS